MKKVFGLVLVLVFFFSFLSANAGPAYERLKVQNLYLVKVVRGQYPSTPLLEAIAEKMKERGLTRVLFCTTDGDLFLFTHVSHIFSDESFKKTIKKHTFSYLLWVLRLLERSKIREEKEWPYLQKLIISDLLSKGFSKEDPIIYMLSLK